MKVVMVVAVSKNEFITNGDNSEQFSWTSDEDKQFLSSMIKKFNLVVTGINTYEASRKKILPGQLRVILTNNPENYSSEEIPNQRAFLNLTPKKFIENFQDSYKSCLVLGGAYVYTEFIKNNLIDEIFMTIEPVSFKSGKSLITNGTKLEDFVKLPEPEVKVLNEKGTTLFHYILKK